MIVLPELTQPAYAETLLDHWRHYPAYGLSSDGGSPLGPALACNVPARPRDGVRAASPPTRPVRFAPGVADRADAGMNFVRTGGRLRLEGDDTALLSARTNYFRATYVSGAQIYAPVMHWLLHHQGLAEAAAQLYARPLVVPSTVYANVMLPGQELGVHTDVPEFRGVNRGSYPMWLLVVMHHSGLFDPWRIHLATGVLHLGGGDGGEFAYYPDGPDGPVAVEPAVHNRALVLDTDSVFHGVDRVGGDDAALHRLEPGATLRGNGGRWRLEHDGRALASMPEKQLRYSISWKARCFADQDERDAVELHSDDLDFDTVIATLTSALAERGRLPASPPSEDELARLMIAEFVRFPP